MNVRHNFLEFADHKARIRPLDQIRSLVIHRIWMSDWDMKDYHSADEVMARFRHDPNVGKYTGYELPYNLIIDPLGQATQYLELQDVGMHAGAFNTASAAIAVMGDFRVWSPNTEQLQTLVPLCQYLCARLGIDPQGETDWGKGRVAPSLCGHSELPGAKPDCPGRNLSMDWLRNAVDIANHNLIAQTLACPIV